MALAAKGISMKRAGLAAGLSSNYVRDVIRRGRGKFELLERVGEANGVSWLWLKTGEGEMDAPGATPKPRVGIKHTAAPPYYREQLELARERRRLPSPRAHHRGARQRSSRSHGTVACLANVWRE